MISKSIGMLKERMEEVSFKKERKRCFARCTIRLLLGQKKYVRGEVRRGYCARLMTKQGRSCPNMPANFKRLLSSASRSSCPNMPANFRRANHESRLNSTY
jgi:hypothetical protein